MTVFELIRNRHFETAIRLYIDVSAQWEDPQDRDNERLAPVLTITFGGFISQYSDMHEHRAVSQLLENLGARRLSHHYSMHEICEVASTGNLQMLRHMVHNGATVCYRDLNKRTPL